MKINNNNQQFQRLIVKTLKKQYFLADLVYHFMCFSSKTLSDNCHSNIVKPLPT